MATGWKLNPVNFDSVFNRSRHTWSWGSPDILPMFERGAVPGRVDAFTYAAELEDFSKDATHLDYWVFDHVKEFFAEAATNQTLNKALRQDKLVFFLHLLGLDTSGHSYRPYSKEYLHNIKVVDQGVKEITELIQKFYADDRTAFVFTADHGMSDWGSHGDGHPDNTRTPLITWGSGLASPELHPGSIAPGHDEYSSDWGLDQVRRHDVDQADVAALMSYLIGTEFPANSVGELPLSYLSADNAEKAKASLVNAEGILEMYRVKEHKKKANELRFRPYRPFSDGGLTPEERLSAIEELINNGQHEEAIEETNTLIQVTLQGMRYLQTYDWLFLRALITIGYLGWMAYAMTTVIDMFVVEGTIPPNRTAFSLISSFGALAGLYASFMMSKSPFTYYIYAFFPVVFWEEVYAHKASLYRGRQALFGHIQSAGGVMTFFFHAAVYVAIIQSLVCNTGLFVRSQLDLLYIISAPKCGKLMKLQAIGYIYREVLTGIYVLAAAWPALYGFSFLQNHATLSITWVVSCLVMSSFTLLPAMKTESVALMYVMKVTMLYVCVCETHALQICWWHCHVYHRRPLSLFGKLRVSRFLSQRVFQCHLQYPFAANIDWHPGMKMPCCRITPSNIAI